MATTSPALQGALAAVRGRWGVHSIVPPDAYRPAVADPDAPATAPPPWWPTPGTAPAAQLLELIGPASSGKLTLTLLWLAALPSDGPLAFVDVAGTVHPPAAAACGLDLRRVVVVRPPQRRDLLHVVLELTRSEGFDAVLVLPGAQRPVAPAQAGQLRSFATAAQTAVFWLREAPTPASLAPGKRTRLTSHPLSPWERDRVRVPPTPSPPTRTRVTAHPLSPWEKDRVRVHPAPPLSPREKAGVRVDTLPLADTRLRVLDHTWLWEDGELAGQRLVVRTERSRQGLAGAEHELTLRLARRGIHGSRPDHLSLDSTRRTRGRDALAATGS